MPTDFGRLLVHLEANFDAYELGMKSAVAYTDRDAGKIEKRLEKMSRHNEKTLSRTTKGLLGTVVTAATLKQVGDYADQWTGVVNNLSTAGLAGEKLKRTLGSVFDAAQRGGIEVGVLSNLHGRLVQERDELDALEEDLLRFTEGVGTALRIEGKPASQTSGAIVQLTQALGSGIVRAEEFNSINEQAKPILQAVANGLTDAGGSVSKLRNLVIAGKVSSKAFFNAFLAGTKSIEGQAAAASETIAQGFTRVDNALTKYIGEADQAAGASAVLVTALTRLADNFESFADTSLQVASIIAGALVGRSIAGMIAKIPVAVAVVMALRLAFAAATGGAAKAAAASGAFGTVLSTVTARVPAASAVISGLGTALNTTAGRAVAMRLALLGLAAAAGPIGLLLGAAATAASLMAMSGEDAASAADIHKKALDDLKDEVKTAEFRSQEYRKKLIAEKKAHLENAKGILAETKALIAQRLERAKELAEGTENQRGMMPQIFTTDDKTGRSRLMTSEEFVRKGGVLDDLVADAEQAEEKVTALEAAIADLDKQQTNSGVSLSDFPVDPSAKKKKKSSQKQDEFEREVAAIQKRTAALYAESAAIGKGTYEAEKARVVFTLTNAAKEAGIPVTAELKTQIEALAEGYAKAAVTVEKMKEAHEKAVEQMDGFRTASRDVLGGFVKDIKNGTSAAEALGNALDKIADKLIDMAVNDLVTAALGQSGSTGGGLLGSLFSSFGGAFGVGTAHRGGVAGVRMGSARMATAAAFAGAQKFHGGGVAKGGGDIPALLRHGEPVFTPEQAATLANLSDIRQIVASERQSVHVTVGVSADTNGSIAPFVERVSRRHAAAAVTESGRQIERNNAQIPAMIKDSMQRGALR